MADIFTSSSAYQGTFVSGTVETDPHFQVCAIANINASNQFECSFWINQNGERVTSDLGSASYLVRDKAGTAVSGLAQGSVTADSNGYYHVTAVSAALIYDLTHYLLEIVIPIDGVPHESSIGIVVGE